MSQNGEQKMESATYGFYGTNCSILQDEPTYLFARKFHLTQSAKEFPIPCQSISHGHSLQSNNRQLNQFPIKQISSLTSFFPSWKDHKHVQPDLIFFRESKIGKVCKSTEIWEQPRKETASLITKVRVRALRADCCNK